MKVFTMIRLKHEWEKYPTIREEIIITETDILRLAEDIANKMYGEGTNIFSSEISDISLNN